MAARCVGGSARVESVWLRCVDRSIKYGWSASVVARCADLLRSRLAMGWDGAVLLRFLGGLRGRGVGGDASSGSSSGIGGSSCWIGASTGCDADSPDDALVGPWGFAGVGGSWGGIGAGIAGWAGTGIVATVSGTACGVGAAIDLVMRLVIATSSSSLLLLE